MYTKLRKMYHLQDFRIVFLFTCNQYKNNLIVYGMDALKNPLNSLFMLYNLHRWLILVNTIFFQVEMVCLGCSVLFLHQFCKCKDFRRHQTDAKQLYVSSCWTMIHMTKFHLKRLLKMFQDYIYNTSHQIIIF